MFDVMNKALRPEGAPENWGVYYVSIGQPDAPQGFVKWAGRHYARLNTKGKSKGWPNWKAPREQQWDRTRSQSNRRS